jgi:hypothetical protein
MQLLLALALSLAPQSACDTFEHGNESLWVTAAPGEDNLDLVAQAAFAGTLGAEFSAPSGASSWRARFDLSTAPGDGYVANVRVRGMSGSQAELGRVSFGVAATVDGALLATLAPDTGEVLVQRVSGWTGTTTVTTLASAPVAVALDTWYRLGLTWWTNGDVEVSVTSTSGVSLARVSAPTNFVNPGGFALWGETGAPGVHIDVDELCLGFQIDPVYSIYCAPAVANSSGEHGRTRMYGSALVAMNDLELVATQLPPGSFGYFLASRTQAFIAMPGNSQGNLCVGGTISRFAAQVFSAGALGRGTAAIDLTTIPLPNGAVSAHPGETWNFQAWYRDANPHVTSNFTDAIAVPFS